jgi:protein-tyrosine-phosphatase
MTAAYQRPDPSVDQDLALRTAAVRLTTERFLHSSYDEFAGRAAIPNHLPLLAERFARQRLHALAKAEGEAGTGVPTVLFLCTRDAGRSQMAMGFLSRLAGDRAVAWSGGSEPRTDEIVRAADVVITTGCGDACPVFPGRRYSEWVLDDPEGVDVAAFRPVRDEIERRVRRLLDELGVAAQ